MLYARKLTPFLQKPLRSDRLCLEQREAQRVEMLCPVVPSRGAEVRPTVGVGGSGPPTGWRRLMWLCSPRRLPRGDSVFPVDWLLPFLWCPAGQGLHISLAPFSQGQLDITIVPILGISPSSSPTRRQGRRSVCPIFQPITALTPTPKNPFLPSHFFSGQPCGLLPDSSWPCATVILSMLWNLDVVGRMASPPNLCPLKTSECGPCLEIGSPQMQLRTEMRSYRKGEGLTSTESVLVRDRSHVKMETEPE